MLINESIRKEITPHRVYCLLKLINFKKYKKEELKNLLQPESLTSSAEFAKVFNYLKENKLIKEDELGYVTTEIKSKVTDSPELFRKYFASRIFENKESNLFFDFTSWYMSQNEGILNYSSYESLINNVKGKFEKLDREFIYAWRFWVPFIGLGFTHNDKIFIHNPFLRIKDAIEYHDDIKRDLSLPLKIFIDWLIIKCPELKEGIIGNKLSYSVSFALRTLHDSGIIILEENQDSPEVWQFVKYDIHAIVDKATHIVIKG